MLYKSESESSVEIGREQGRARENEIEREKAGSSEIQQEAGILRERWGSRPREKDRVIENEIK